MTKKYGIAKKEDRVLPEMWNTIYTKEPQYSQLPKIILELTLKTLKSAKAKAKTVLEIGCGEGELAKYLLDQGFEVTGIDLSKVAIERARKNAPGATFIVDDFMTHKFNQHYDLVICNLVLAFINDKPSFFEKVAKLTESRSGLLLRTPAWLDNLGLKPAKESKAAKICVPYFETLTHACDAFSSVYEVERGIDQWESQVNQIIFCTNNKSIPRFSTDKYFRNERKTNAN